MIRRASAILLSGALLAGCAHTGGAASSRATASLPGKEQCLFSSQVRGWQTLDESTLLVDGPTGGTTYLFKLFAPVTGLRFEETLAFIDGNHDGQLCSIGDSLAVDGPVPQTVPIVAVRVLDKNEADALRKPDAKKGTAAKAVSP